MSGFGHSQLPLPGRNRPEIGRAEAAELLAVTCEGGELRPQTTLDGADFECAATTVPGMPLPEPTG
jgi:hypothetical protein